MATVERHTERASRRVHVAGPPEQAARAATARQPRRPTALRIPPGTWRWWETQLVLLAVSTLVAAVALLDRDVDPHGFAVRVAVVAYALALGSSVLLYLHWRIAGGGPLGWLVLGLAGVSIHALAMAGLVAGDPQRVVGRPGMLLVTRVVLGLGALLVLLLAGRRIRLDPLAVGIGLGTLLFAARYAVLVYTPHLNLPADDLDRLALVVLLTDLTVAAGIAAFPRAPRWVRYRIALALAAIGVANATAYPVPSDDSGPVSIMVSGYVVGTAVLLSVAIALVRVSIRDNRRAIHLLRDQLLRTEAVARSEQAQLHEIRSTIAGISSAAQIISSYQAIAPSRRASIHQMITAEIGRLERLTSVRADGLRVGRVDLDETLLPLVTRVTAQGHPVDWIPAGEVAMGRADDIAEVVNVLLDNAVRHGGGSGLRLRTCAEQDWVSVVVSDAGPGIPPNLREHVFDWGVSGTGSAGDGIGLNVARGLAEGLGGSLDLVDTPDGGATFVLQLPAPRREAS